MLPHALAARRRSLSIRCQQDRSIDEAFANELSQRGMLTSLQEIEQDGPSAFKDPRKIVECASHKTHPRLRLSDTPALMRSQT